MKQTNIIQRLCLFLLLMVSAMGAWAEKSVLFNSTESGKSKTVTTLTKSPVTIKFDNCKTSGAGNIYELVKGTGLTISVTSGYRIREIVLEDTEGGHDYDNGGLDRIGSYSDASYSMAFVKNSGSQPDNNNIQFRNYDAPAQSFRIVGHNMSNKGQLKIRRITVVYVSEGNIRFTIPSKTIHVGEEWRFAYGSITASTSGFTNSEITHSVGNNEIATCKSINGGSTCAVQGMKVGETTLNVKAGPSSNATAAYASIPLYVVRNDLSLTPSYTSKTIKAWETLDIAYPMNRPNDYNPTLNDAGVSVVSSDESVVKYDTSLKKLVFGGTGYDKTADVTVTFPQTDKYNEVSYTFQVTVDNEMHIASKDDWQTFANQVKAGNTSINATMTADVDLQTDVIEVGKVYPFTGTFDGDGHTLSLNWNIISKDEAAPFLKTSGGATIKNLHTKGKITTVALGTSGLIDRVVGKTTISGCISEVDITSSYADGPCGASGLVFLNKSKKGDMTITDCIVKGTFNGTTELGSKGMSGFVYNHEFGYTISNSLYLGSNNGGDWSDTFAKDATITNCYYLNPCGTAQGTQVTADQLKSGEVAHLLQGDRTDQFWGQMLGTEDEPQFTADAAKHIYKVDFTYNDKVVASRYANTGKGINGTMPTLQEILGDSYDANHYYSGLTFADGFTASTAVTADKTVAVTLTDNGYFEIATADDWKAFCDLVNGGQITVDAKLTKDIDLGSNVWMIGNSRNPYSGTFDGDGHTLSLNWNISNTEAAPFRNTSGGTTIKNLHIKGQITTNDNGTSGLIARVMGKTTISRCISEVDITSSYADGTCGASGLVSLNSQAGDLTITDCIVKGTFNATTERGCRGMGGFVYDQEAVCTINNSLYLGSNNGGDWSKTFANATITNCYYLNPCGTAQGTQVTADQLKSGEVAHLLQGDRTDQFWGQMLGTEDEPQFTADAAKHIYKVDFTYNDKVVASRYANTGKGINGTMPTLQEILGDSYDANHYYSGLTFADGFTASTAVTADKTVAVTLTDNGYFEIATADDWKAFCDLVNGGQITVDAKLTKDIDLGSNVWMIGNSRNPYSGTFDGDGHTLSLNWNISNTEAAPFRNTSGGTTIKNLHIKGQITTNDNGTSGLIARVMGKTTISRCISEVDITSSYAIGGCNMSGLVSLNQNKKGDLTITDCIVKGTFNGTTELGSWGMSGFVYNQEAVCTISNSLYLGSNNGGVWSRTFAQDATITNCYYLNPCGTAQGTQVTEKQLKNGYVTKLLQADRTDACYWAQQLGEMPSLYSEADKGKDNYVYYDTENSKWACGCYKFSESSEQSIGIDFTATQMEDDRNFPYPSSHGYTWCLPFEQPIQGFSAYTLSGCDGSTLRFKEVTGKLEAYRPYYIVLSGLTTRGGNDIEVKAFNTDALTSAIGDYCFVGTVDGMDNAEAAAAGAYILQSDGLFHKVTTGNTAAVIPPYRAYITLSSDNQASGAKQLSISLGGETTGIRAIETTDQDGTVRYYDLQGRYIGTTLDGQPKGIYIKNGKKTLKK